MHFSFVEGRKGEEDRACFALGTPAAWPGLTVPGAQLIFLHQKADRSGADRKLTVGQAGRSTLLGHQLHKGSQVHLQGCLCPHANLPSEQVRRLRAGGVDWSTRHSESPAVSGLPTGHQFH